MSHTVIEFHNKFARFNSTDLAIAVLLLIQYFKDIRPNFAKAFENWVQSFQVLSIIDLELEEYIQNDNQQVEFLQMLEKMILNLQIADTSFFPAYFLNELLTNTNVYFTDEYDKTYVIKALIDLKKVINGIETQDIL